MVQPVTKRGFLIGLLSVALLLAAIAAAPGAAAIASRTCTPTLSASRSILPNGGSVTLVGHACGRRGRLLGAWDHRWHRLAKIDPRRGGRFVKRVRLRVHRGVHAVKIRAASPVGISPQVRVKLARRRAPTAEGAAPRVIVSAAIGAAAPVGDEEPRAATPAPAPVTTPGAPALPTGPGNEDPPGEPRSPCSMTSVASAAALPMEDPGCALIASDTAAEQSPIPFWSSIQCASTSRYSYGAGGGDTHPAATGALQRDEALRRLTVLDGDEYYGSRCELGENDSFTGNTVFYHQGEHLATYMSIRLPSNFPLSTSKWQVVAQMKQTQPANAGGGAPILDLEARDDEWILVNSWNQIWSVPAKKGVWTRFAWDVYYSADPGEGQVQLSVDANGDGDFDDPGERSPAFHVQTLKPETSGTLDASDGVVAAGAPIPSHLRMGLYHDPSISCPPPDGCSVELDNVQVLGPR